jgi:hypothetical protein
MTKSNNVKLTLTVQLEVDLGKNGLTIEDFVSELKSGYQSFHPQGAYIISEKIVRHDVNGTHPDFDQ